MTCSPTLAAPRPTQRFAVLSGPYPGAQHEAEADKALIDSLNQLCGYAAGKGLSVVVETFEDHV